MHVCSTAHSPLAGHSSIVHTRNQRQSKTSVAEGGPAHTGPILSNPAGEIARRGGAARRRERSALLLALARSRSVLIAQDQDELKRSSCSSSTLAGSLELALARPVQAGPPQPASPQPAGVAPAPSSVRASVRFTQEKGMIMQIRAAPTTPSLPTQRSGPSRRAGPI